MQVVGIPKLSLFVQQNRQGSLHSLGQLRSRAGKVFFYNHWRVLESRFDIGA